jgi:hypothetical protein
MISSDEVMSLWILEALSLQKFILVNVDSAHKYLHNTNFVLDFEIQE